MKQIIYFLWVVSHWDLHEGKACFLLSWSARKQQLPALGSATDAQTPEA